MTGLWQKEARSRGIQSTHRMFQLVTRIANIIDEANTEHIPPPFYITEQDRYRREVIQEVERDLCVLAK